MGLPFFQSDFTLVPKKYCFTIAGFVNASQTFEAGALISTDVFNVRFAMIIRLLFNCYIVKLFHRMFFAEHLLSDQIKIVLPYLEKAEAKMVTPRFFVPDKLQL